MITISLCMIVKNESSLLARVLDSVQDAVDEIIIVDTGSADATKEIAGHYTQKIYDFPWVNDFSAARNFAYSKATMDYQMWLDGDDFLPLEEKEKLLSLKHTLSPDVDMVTMKYHTHFDAAGNPVLTSTRERLTKRIKNFKWQDPVHECIPLTGNIFYSDITIHHLKENQEGISTRNLDIYTALEATGAPFSPRQQYYFARELKDHGNYKKAARYFLEFLDGEQGWVEDNIGACFNLCLCYKALGERKKILPILFRSFYYDSPRAEICCEIGYYYQSRKQYQWALDWFELACKLKATNSLGFILRDYWGFIPYIECCVCCCHLEQWDRAEAYNALAEEVKPGNKATAQNKKYIRIQKEALSKSALTKAN